METGRVQIKNFTLGYESSYPMSVLAIAMRGDIKIHHRAVRRWDRDSHFSRGLAGATAVGSSSVL
jgi:hypothetical protein